MRIVFNAINKIIHYYIQPIKDGIVLGILIAITLLMGKI